MKHDPASIRPDTDPPSEPDAAVEADRLMSRLIDHEATGDERSRFETLAQSDFSLWRELAERLIDMGMLAKGVAERTESAEAVHLPPSRRRTAPVRLAVTFSGWAAVLVVGLVWWLAAASSDPINARPVERDPDPQIEAPMTAEQLIQEYLKNELVLGELEPILLQVERLEDGRYRVRYLRRIEEFLILDELPVPLDEPDPLGQE